MHVSDSEKDSRSSNLASYIFSYTPDFRSSRVTRRRVSHHMTAHHGHASMPGLMTLIRGSQLSKTARGEFG